MNGWALGLACCCTPLTAVKRSSCGRCDAKGPELATGSIGHTDRSWLVLADTRGVGHAGLGDAAGDPFS
jgi:hypothetical protein